MAEQLILVSLIITQHENCTNALNPLMPGPRSSLKKIFFFAFPD